MLYVNPAPVGAVTVIVPVETAHVVGDTAVTVGVAGAGGTGLTVTLTAEEIHPAVFLTVTV